MQLITTNELSKLLKISKQKIYKMVQNKELPPPIKLTLNKINGKWRWLLFDIENWLKN